MASVISNGIQLEYEIYGEHNSNTLLMIQGLSMQLIDWPKRLIEELSKYYRVVIFDNRDVGLSSKIYEDKNFENMNRNVSFFEQDISYSSYSLFDMAEDSLCLMDSLGIDRFHLLGFSMGGMIAQIVAAKNPDRVLSLVSLLSSGGQEEIESSSSARYSMELSSMNSNIQIAIQNSLDAAYVYAGSNHKVSELNQNIAIKEGIERSYCPNGIYRQGLAMRSSGDRQNLLRKIKAPTLIIHGVDDPCIPIHQGLKAAELISNSKLCVVEGLGHDFPDDMILYFSSCIISHCGS